MQTILSFYKLIAGWLLAGSCILFATIEARAAENHKIESEQTKRTWDDFEAMPVSDAVFKRMWGRSYQQGCPVKREDLRYLRVRHYDREGKEYVGEMICHRSIAKDLLEIFRALHKAHYPIERMRLIDDYGANDEQSMAANNSSAFNYRRVAGSKKLSAHSYGLAVDLNPKYNPYVRKGGRLVSPKGSARYANRRLNFDYKITADDLCVRLFKQHGFRWGGDWRNVKDYQHFEKPLSTIKL